MAEDYSGKSMSAYELFAWRDACSLAKFVVENDSVSEVRTQYSRLELKDITDYEAEIAESVAEFLSKTETGRPAYLKKFVKETDVISGRMLVILSILALLRTKELYRIRDLFSHSLNPGRGYRVNNASIYQLTIQVKDSIRYDWPAEAFEAIGEF